MGETQLILLASIGTCAALILSILCCIRTCIRRQPQAQLIETDGGIHENNSSIQMDKQILIINKEEVKSMSTPISKQEIDYQQLNKQFQNDEIDKNAMVISVFNLENESSFHKKRKLSALKRSANSSFQSTPNRLSNHEITIRSSNQ